MRNWQLQASGDYLYEFQLYRSFVKRYW